MSDERVIVLVEDNPNDAFFVERALERIGFEGKIEHFEDIETAQAYIAKSDADPRKAMRV